MRIPRPWRRERGGQKAEAPLTPRLAPEDDARLLRRTRLRLMAVSGAVTLLLLVLLGAAVYTATSNAYRNDSITRLHDYANTKAAQFAQRIGLAPPTRQPGGVDFEFGSEYAGLFVVGVDSSGELLFWSNTLPPGVPVQAGLDAVGQGGTDVREVTTGRNVQLRIFSQAETLPNGSTYLIQTAATRADEVNLLNLLRTVLLAGGALAFLAALVAGYLYAGRALVPIRASIDRREAALQRQREFTANGSHELRTPLTVIRASVEDLRRNSRSRVEDVGDALGDMEAEVRHLTALVDDMLLLARTDSGVVQVECAPLDLGDVAVEATSTLSTLGEERGVSVVADPLPASVLGDPLRLRQLVTILVDNAIRHSSSGSTVTVRVRAASGGAYLWVEDEGHGIKPEDLPRLFERFWRADNAPVGGTGLGLSIARWIVEQHGGTIGAENRPEGGARFWAQIPSLKPNARNASTADVWANPEAAANSEVTADPEAAQPSAWRPGDQDQPIL
jgi:signal transduction histidine kinase